MRMGEEIVQKGEMLRNLYLIRQIIEEMHEVVADGVNIKGMLSADDFVRKIDQVIPLIERELPEWAKERARQTFSRTDGFVIWEPNLKTILRKGGEQNGCNT